VIVSWYMCDFELACSNLEHLLSCESIWLRAAHSLPQCGLSGCAHELPCVGLLLLKLTDMNLPDH